MEEIEIGRYKIDSSGKVSNIVCKESPEGNFCFDPFEKKSILPFWGVLCTTFEGLNSWNKEYLLNNIERYNVTINELRLQKFWLFWFSDGDLNNQKELFFIGSKAKESAYLVQHIFNEVLETNVDALLNKIKSDINTLENN